MEGTVMGLRSVMVWIEMVLCDGRDRLSAICAVALSKAQEGQSLVEYGILAALIAIVCVAAVQALGTGVAGVFTRILSSISGIG